MGLRSATEISASLSQMFASKFNDDKKTLAFSDSVQDAAHKAGFFNSRTWRFGLRTGEIRKLNAVVLIQQNHGNKCQNRQYQKRDKRYAEFFKQIHLHPPFFYT